MGAFGRNKVELHVDTGLSGEYSAVLYLNTEGLCDLVGMVDCIELLTVWRPDLRNTELCLSQQ